MENYVVEIQQGAVTDLPNFPRPAGWWEQFLPLWFFEPTWWKIAKGQWRIEVALSSDSTVVNIAAQDARHAKEMLDWLSNCPAMRDHGFGFAIIEL